MKISSIMSDSSNLSFVVVIHVVKVPKQRVTRKA